MKTSEELSEIAKALSALQGEMDIASKDSKGYNYKYSDLSSVWRVVKGPLSKNGLCITQDAISLPEGVSVSTRVIHSS